MKFYSWLKRAAISAVLLGVSLQAGLAGEIRTWTDVKGNALEAEYLRSTEDSVTVRLKTMQNRTFPISAFSDADQEYIADIRKKELESKLVTVVMKGEVVWKLDNMYYSMGWSTEQGGELWYWDEVKKEPREKITDVKVEYYYDYMGNRNDLVGNFTTGELTVNPEEKIVLITKLEFSKNNKKLNLEDTSVPMALPQARNGEVKLPTARASARRGS